MMYDHPGCYARKHRMLLGKIAMSSCTRTVITGLFRESISANSGRHPGGRRMLLGERSMVYGLRGCGQSRNCCRGQDRQSGNHCAGSARASYRYHGAFNSFVI